MHRPSAIGKCLNSKKSAWLPIRTASIPIHVWDEKEESGDPDGAPGLCSRILEAIRNERECLRRAERQNESGNAETIEK
jgi:hypothetical protein